jgi:prophage regulatory protein
MSNQSGVKILRMKDVVQITGLSRSAIYQKVACNQFPKQIKLGVRATGWLLDEVICWLNNQIAISRAKQGL